MIDPYHQLVPKYNKTGAHKMIVWYSHNKGHNVILAQNEDHLKLMVKDLYERNRYHYDEPTIKSLWEIDIVLPPTRIADAYAKEMREKELVGFKGWLHELASAYLKAYNELPQGFEQCDKFEPGDYGDNEYIREHHIDCGNCHSSKLMTTLDTETIYEQHKGKYRQDEQLRWQFKRPRPKPFLGKGHDPNKALFVASGNFGPHCTGIEIEKVEDNYEASPTVPDLFYFHGTINEVPAWVKEVFDGVVKMRKEGKTIKKQQAMMEEIATLKTRANLLRSMLRTTT